MSAGLNDDNDDEEGPDADPFIPQERVFSKYAAMLYSSNNQGRSFEEFKDAKFCPSCGEKVYSLFLHNKQCIVYNVYEQGNMKKEWCETSKEESYSYFYPSMYTNIPAAIVD